MPLVDVHNHILSREYADLLARFGGHRSSLARRIDALPVGEAEKELIRSGNARRLFKL